MGAYFFCYARGSTYIGMATVPVGEGRQFLAFGEDAC